MMNLFSVFDPTSYFNISLNWLILLLMFLFVPFDYYMIKSSYKSVFMLFYKSISIMFNEIANPNHLALSFLSMVTFMYLILNNLFGLFPFIFTSTAHPKITLGFGLVLWISFFIMGWLSNFKNSAAHLVPEGSPLLLSPLMVLIESISHLIRPFTLSIRLAANMMAGHLIVGLLSSISLTNLYGFFISLTLQSILLILEFGVAMIQGFVFSILLLLYALEYY